MIILLFIFALFSLSLSPRALAQAANAGAISGQTINLQGYPAAGATVRVCPVTAVGTPCFPLATLYSDSALTQPLPNPLTADNAGNYRAFIASGLYTLQVTVPGQSSPSIYTYYASPGGSSGGTGGAVNPASVPRPLGYYALAGSTISPTVAAASAITPGATYSNFLGPQGIANFSWLIGQRPRIDATHPNFGVPAGCTNPADPGSAVTAFSITSNVATLTANNPYQIGQNIWIDGLTTGNYLNNSGSATPYVITAASPTQFSFAFTHANVTTTVDAGSAGTDSTCAIRAAIGYVQTAYGVKSTGPFPQTYLPAGRYFISGAIRVPQTYVLIGDKRAPTIVEQTNTSANHLTVYSDGSNTPNVNGFGMHGGIYDLTLICGTALSGTPGQAFNGCIGTEIEITNNVQGFEVEDVGFMNTGGRGLAMGGAAEEMHLHNLWFYGVRWPIVNIGQATDSVHDIIMSSTGSTTGQYYFSSNSVLGQIAAESSQTWNPATTFLTSLTFDGNGGMQFTVSCTVSPTCLTKGINGTSSPIAPGMWFKIAGVTAGGFTQANGTYQATAVTGASGSPSIISSCPVGDTSSICPSPPPAQAQQGGTYTNWSVNYGPDEKVQFTCTTTPGCTPTLQTPAAGTTTSLTGSWWGPSVFPDMQSSIYAPTTANIIENVRDSPTWNQAMIQFPIGGGASLKNYYCEGFPLHGEPHLNPCVRVGGYLPWTNFTSSLAGAATCSGVAPCIISVFDTSWFPNYANDPQDITNAGASGNFIVLMCADYNATQVGVPCAANPSVNTNQYEVVAAVFSGPNSVYITARQNGASTAPAGTTWGIGTKIGWNRGFSPVAGGGGNTLQVSASHSVTIVPDKGNWDPECSDQGPNYCATIDIGVGYDQTTFWPQGFVGAYVPSMGVTLEDVFVNKCGQGSSLLLGADCAKVHGAANVVLRQSTLISNSTMDPPPAAQNGTYIGMVGQGVIATQYLVNGVPFVSNITVQDDNTHMVGFGSPNAANLMGAYFGKADIIKANGMQFGFSTSTPANTTVGEQITGVWNWFDQGSTNKTATITSWTLSGSTVTFQATNTFAAGVDCVTLTGLTQGAFMNSANANGTCYPVSSPTGSQFSISTLGNGILIHPYNGTSATESGTATSYHSGWKMFFHGGPTFTGTAICGGWKEWTTGGNWTYTPFQVCEGSTPGSTGSVTTPVGTPVTFNDALTVNGVTTLAGGFTSNGTITVGALSNLIPNSLAMTAGTWSATIGTPTITGGQIDPGGGTNAFQFAVGAGTTLYVDAYGTTPLLATTSYNNCAWMKGSVGGEVVSLGNSTVISPVTLASPPTWEYKCVTVTSSSGSLQRVWAFQTSSAETFYLAGASTTLAANNPGFLLTGATPSPTPTLQIVVYPFSVPTLSANGGTTLPLTDLCTGTPSSGKYCDGGGAWTALPGAGYTLYGGTGVALTGAHGAQANVTLSGGTLVVTLTGASVFTSATSYVCQLRDTTTPANAVTAAYSSGSSFTLTGTGTDAVLYSCTGN